MSSTNQFHVRNARPDGEDGQFIVAAFNSTLPYLTTIGSGEQWGSKPFSERHTFVEETMQSIEQSERYRRTGEGDALSVLIAEVETPAATAAANGHSEADGVERLLPVGAATVRENWFPAYITSRPRLESITTEAKDFLFLEVLVTDFRTGSHREGAGAALIQHIERHGREKGKNSLYVDCWAGNDEKLNRYYERQGFTKVGNFSLERSNKTLWRGTLLCMDLASEEKSTSSP